MSLHIPDSDFIWLNESKRVEILLSFAVLTLQRGENSENDKGTKQLQPDFKSVAKLFQDFKVRIHSFHMHTPWTCVPTVS